MLELAGTPIAAWTTLRLGGPARRVVVAETTADVVSAVLDADRRREATLLLAGGSNVVVGDAGWDGLVVRIASRGIEVERTGPSQVRVTVAAGEGWDDLVARAVASGWSGVECLAGIPGSVGATPMQNVGAYGQEIGDTLEKVRVLDRDSGASSWIAAGDCALGYRTSRFRGSARFVLLEVAFTFAESRSSAPIAYAELAASLGVAVGEQASSDRVREVVIGLRRRKGMVVDPQDPESVSAGSFFTNPLVDAQALAHVEAVAAAAQVPRFAAGEGRWKIPAAWLIERAGFARGFSLEGAGERAGISRKHALALVNRGGTTRDLLALASAIQVGVRQRFGVTLEPEPVLVGCGIE